MKFHAIPTEYKGQRFRSRIEARWASFFDEMHWRWSYEPLDLKGYIPDFILHFYKPLLVEVKSEVTIEGLKASIEKVELSGWDGEILLVGACLFECQGWFGSPALGLLKDCEFGETGDYAWSTALLQACRNCNKISLIHDHLSFRCRVSGCWDGDHFVNAFEMKEAEYFWRVAGNSVQWHPKP